MMSRLLSVLVVALVIGASRQVDAQVSAPTTRRPDTIVGHLGITGIECDCTFDGRNSDERIFRFRSNPVVLRVARRGPSAGKLFRGDTIVDIDGRPLRSAAGGSSFANLRPGQHVTLGVHRAGRLVRVAVTAGAIAAYDPSGFGQYVPRCSGCGDSESNPSVDDYYAPATPRPAPRATPAPPAESYPPGVVPPRAMQPSTPTPGVPRVPRAPGVSDYPPTASTPLPGVPPTVPAGPASPRGWFGFSIRCNQCGWSRSGRDVSPHWESFSPPEISLVAPGGPAATAGFRRGDRITHIDGASILQPEGARRFGAVTPGQSIRLTVDRNGEIITRQLTLAQRPGSSSGRTLLRYTGRLSDVDVEVWSPAAASVQRSSDTLTITVGGSTVRLKVRD